jgi:hypothetical protein
MKARAVRSGSTPTGDSWRRTCRALDPRPHRSGRGGAARKRSQPPGGAAASRRVCWLGPQIRTVSSQAPETMTSRSPTRPSATAATVLVWPVTGAPSGCPSAVKVPTPPTATPDRTASLGRTVGCGAERRSGERLGGGASAWSSNRRGMGAFHPRRGDAASTAPCRP